MTKRFFHPRTRPHWALPLLAMIFCLGSPVNFGGAFREISGMGERIMSSAYGAESPSSVLGTESDADQSLVNAAAAGDISSIDRALAHGAHINARTKFGNTPLMWAINLGHPEAVRHLLQKGANPDLGNANAITPLMVAILTDQETSLRLLLAYHANPNALSRSGMTPLILAAGRDSLPAARLLLSHGALVNLPGKAGQTPLMWAAQTGDRQLVRLFLTHGANPRATDKNGRTAAGLIWETHPRTAKLIDGWKP
ncbi:MAG: ankyrin repeat domain-containing protein [Leptospirillia bacterium]